MGDGLPCTSAPLACCDAPWAVQYQKCVTPVCVLHTNTQSPHMLAQVWLARQVCREDIMQSISRRGFVISATAAAAAFGLDGPLEFLAPAFAQKADKGFVKFKVGDIEVIQMYDGVWEKAHDPAFVKNASLDDVKAALKAGGLTDAHVPIPFTVTAIRTRASSCCSTPAPAPSSPRRRASSPRTTCGRRPASTRPRSTASSSRTSTATTSAA